MSRTLWWRPKCVSSASDLAGQPSAFGSRRNCLTPAPRTDLASTQLISLATLLFGKTIQSVRVVGNVGVGILADPVRADRQNDVLLWGGSFARAVAEGVELVGEINGRLDTRAGEPPPGTENRGVMRLGARYTRGAGRVDAGLLVGMTSRDPDRWLHGRVYFCVSCVPGALTVAQ